MFYLYISVFSLLLLFIILLVEPLSELKVYRSFIRKPEDLFALRGVVVLVEYPNIGKRLVRIGGQDFSSSLVVNWMLHDIARLKKKGFEIDREYLYDKRPPFPKDIFEKMLAEYKTALHYSKTGSRFFGDQKAKPIAPYDFSTINILPPMNRT